MSVTKHLVCVDCKEYIWIGQGQVIYSGMPEVMEALCQFLNKHQYNVGECHQLYFCDEHQYGDGVLADCTEFKERK